MHTNLFNLHTFITHHTQGTAGLNNKAVQRIQGPAVRHVEGVHSSLVESTTHGLTFIGRERNTRTMSEWDGEICSYIRNLDLPQGLATLSAKGLNFTDK